MNAAWVVAGLGFGDEGKGTITDAIVRRESARLVVRYNGGAQAAHHVVCTDGRWHSFHQFGSGSFADARTHLSRFMLVDPFQLQREARTLLQNGVVHPWGRISVDHRCLVTTPYQQAMNRIREVARLDGRHGSCGMGIGETVNDELTGRPVVRIKMLGKFMPLRDTLEAIRKEKLSDALALGVRGEYLDLLKSTTLSEHYARRYLDVAALLPQRQDADVLDTAIGPVVFEGAQGALLDQDCGFAPHTTWSKTSAQNALALIAELGRNIPTEVVGVVRSYATRHGAGPLPTELSHYTDWLADDHNVSNEWQGTMRVGAFDMAMLKYAIAINCDKVTQLAVTHMDKVTADWPVCEKYENFGGGTLTEAVEQARPVYTKVPADRFLQKIFEETGLRAGIVSCGPTAAEKMFFMHAMKVASA
jgi:adenylosuccinate synthase